MVRNSIIRAADLIISKKTAFNKLAKFMRKLSIFFIFLRNNNFLKKKK